MFQQFLNQYNNKYVDWDGVYGAQCFDLVNRWSTYLGYRPFTGLYAYGIIDQTQGNYTKILNSPTAVPQAGDIIVWNSRYGGGYGHTAIASGIGDTNFFESFDQNYPTGSPAHLVRHSYDGVIGWLRPNKLTTGGNMAVIGSGDNWYARLSKLHEQVRGRPLGRDVFNAFVGKDLLTYVEAVSDDPEADAVQNYQNVGAVAVKDNWQQQIYTLQKQFADATKLANDLQARLVASENTTKALTEKVDALNKKVAELDSPDNIVVSRGFFNGLFDRIKSFISRG
jgi:hypothetical protein